MTQIFSFDSVYTTPETSRSHPAYLCLSNAKLPTDPFFLATVTLQNIVVGSRYWIAQASDLTNILATGVAAVDEVVLDNIPSYANPMLMEIRVRHASGVIKYSEYTTFSYLVKTGTNVYIAQAENVVLNG